MVNKVTLTLFLIFLVISPALQFSLDPSKRFILDSKGRYSVFHGVNVVMKLPPYFPKRDVFDPLYSLNSQDIEIMKRMGFNVVRLGVIWEAVEKAEGVYDYDYLAKVKDLVEDLGKNGIYTILDAHQDCMSRKICGEGMPSFYLEKIGYDEKCDSSFTAKLLGAFGVCKPMSEFNLTYDEQGLPLIEDCKQQSFVNYHFSPELTTAYENFYKNVYDIQDKFTNFWVEVAKYFKGNQYVLGFDLWNEPFPGGLFDNPLLAIFPNHSDMNQILPLYRKVDKALREIDPNYILFFENMPFPDNLPICGGIVVGKFTERVNLDENANQVYNVHNYCCMSGINVCEGPEPSEDDAKNRCPGYHQSKLRQNLNDAAELNVPLFVTEFGACSDSEACYNEVAGFVKAAEPNFISWAYWNYKPYGDFTTSAIALVNKEGVFLEDGNVQEVKERSLTRAYVQYYQGKPVSFTANEDNGFDTEFIFNKNITENTVLYLNRNKFFSKGAKFEVVSDGETVSCDIVEDGSNYVYFKNIDAKYDGKTIKISLKPIS